MEKSWAHAFQVKTTSKDRSVHEVQFDEISGRWVRKEDYRCQSKAPESEATAMLAAEHPPRRNVRGMFNFFDSFQDEYCEPEP